MDAAEVEEHMFSIGEPKLHGGMCKILSAIYCKVFAIFPDLEVARPRSTSGIQALCSLHIALEKTKNVLQHCSECSKFYLAITGDSVVLKFEKARCALEDGLRRVEDIVPQAIGCQVPSLPDEARNQDAERTTLGLEKKLEEICISDSRQVIIPKHIHVPEVEKLGFFFGSFDANFGLSTSYPGCPENEKSPPIPETSKGMEENPDQTSNHNELMSVEEEDYSPASADVSESLIYDVHDVSSRVVPEYSESKQETDLPPGYQKYSTVHTYPNFGFGIMPSMIGSQDLPNESAKSQTHDVSRLPGFVSLGNLKIRLRELFRAMPDYTNSCMQGYGTYCR